MLVLAAAHRVQVLVVDTDQHHLDQGASVQAQEEGNPDPYRALEHTLAEAGDRIPEEGGRNPEAEAYHTHVQDSLVVVARLCLAGHHRDGREEVEGHVADWGQGQKQSAQAGL